MKPWEQYGESQSQSKPWEQYSEGFDVSTPEKYAAVNAQLPPSANPTGNFGQNALAGVGQAFTQTGQGIQQLLGVPGIDAKIAERQRLDAPLNATGGGVTGNILGHMAQLPFGGATLKGAAALGAGYSALQPGSAQERLANAGMGGLFGAGGQLAGQGIGHLLRPGRGVLPNAQKLMDEGVPLSPADKTGSRVLGVAEETLANTPGAMNQAQQFSIAQQRAFNRAALAKSGIAGDIADEPALIKAYSDFSDAYKGLLGDRQITLDEDWWNGVTEVLQINKKLPETLRSKQIDKLANELYGMGYGQPIQATEIQATRSALSEMSRSLRRTGKKANLQKALDKVVNVMDDALIKDLPEGDKWTMNQLRRSYANMKLVEQAVDEVGNISPARLNQVVKGTSKSNYARGKGDLTGLAKAGKEILPAKLGSSGTSERQAMGKLMNPSAQAPTGGLLGALVAPDPLTGAALGYLAPTAGANLARRGMFSNAGQQYLTHGIPGTQGLINPLRQAGAAAGIAEANSPRHARFKSNAFFGNDRLSRRQREAAQRGEQDTYSQYIKPSKNGAGY